MARSAFVTEEEVTVLHQGAKVGKSRGFYVGEDITEEDVKAKFEEGILKLSVPKKEPKPEEEVKKMITIE